MTKKKLLRVLESLADIYISHRSIDHQRRTDTHEVQNSEIMALLKPHHFQAAAYTRKQKQLVEQLETAKAAIAHVPRAVVATDSTGHLLWFTPSGQHMFRRYYAIPIKKGKRIPLSLRTWIKSVFEEKGSIKKRYGCAEPLTITKGTNILTVQLTQLNDQHLLILNERSATLSLEELTRYGLTPRERGVLGLLIHGKSNPEMAKKLGIKIDTVQKHLTNIYTKLGVDNRTAAVSMALETIWNGH